MKKQLHYDQNSLTQSVLALFLNKLYSSELEQHFSEKLIFVDGQIEVFDYVDIIAKYCSLTKRPSYAGINLKDQARVNMLWGVMKDIKFLMKSGPEKAEQIQEKLKYFERLFTNQYAKKWILNYLTYIDFWIFELSFEVQKYSPKFYKQNTFLSIIRSNILEVDQISEKAKQLVDRLGLNDLPVEEEAKVQSQNIVNVEQVQVNQVDVQKVQENQSEKQNNQKVGKFKQEFIIQSKQNAIEGDKDQEQTIQKAFTQNNSASEQIHLKEQISYKVQQNKTQQHGHQKIGKFKEQFIIQSKQNAIDGDKQQEQIVDKAFQQNITAQKQQIPLISQPENKPQDSQVREVVSQTIQTTTENVEQTTKIKGQRAVIVELEQTKTVQIQKKTEVTTQDKENVSNENIQIKKQQRVELPQNQSLKQEKSEQQIQQIQSDKPKSMMLPQFDPKQKKKQQSVKKQAGCTCLIY